MRLWKLELQKLADQTGLVIHVHHYPPGTSKWNKIEHRMFCHITQNGRGRPLTDRLAVVELIGATTTKTGLKVESALDTRSYQKGIKVSKAAMKSLDITGDPFHPEWKLHDQAIRPRQPLDRSSYCSACPKSIDTAQSSDMPASPPRPTVAPNYAKRKVSANNRSSLSWHECQLNCSSNTFASFRSGVSKPSVNQAYTGNKSSRASILRPCRCQS